MRIAYAGTPEFAVPALSAIAARGHEIVAVYSQPDRAAGRGRTLTASPVKLRALELGLRVLQPESLKDEEQAALLRALAPDVMVVAAYGLLLPANILAIPRHGCLNIHASLLPRWRGAAPVQRAIEAGDAETGVCIMAMEAGLDTGAVLTRAVVPILPTDTAASLTDTLSEAGAALLVETLDAVASGRAEAIAQPADGVTYARKVQKSEARIDWSAPAALISRRVRAFQPWPVAETTLDGETLRIWGAQTAAGEGQPGTIVAVSGLGIDVAASDGAVRLTRLQAAGRKPVSAHDFLNSNAARVAVGTVLGT